MILRPPYGVHADILACSHKILFNKEFTPISCKKKSIKHGLHVYGLFRWALDTPLVALIEFMSLYTHYIMSKRARLFQQHDLL